MNWDFQMTKEDALARQARDIQHYGPRYPGGEAALRAKVQSMTKADTLEEGRLYDIGVINRCIPRGGVIEDLVGIADQGGE